MKKFCLIFLLFLVFTITPFTNAESEDEFYNINLETNPRLFNSNRVTCKVTWETNEKIYYLKVKAVLQNNGAQVFELMVDQVKEDENQSFTSNLNSQSNLYENVLQFDLYYFQTGNMEITFNYSYEILPPTEETLSKTLYFVNNNWKSKQTTKNAIICGIVITLGIAICTYVVIENSQRDITFTHIKGEDDE